MALRSDLPSLRQSSMGGFIAGIVAVLVFISGLAVTATGAIGGLLDSWNTSVTGTLTIQVPGENADAAQKALRVLNTVKNVDGVKRAEIVSNDRVRELLKPWLGDAQLIADLPLPVLIDVELSAPSSLAIDRVSTAVKTTDATAQVDDHRAWLNRIAEFATALGYMAFALIVLSLAGLTITVIFATRASLTEYTQVIEVLHLVGARDHYIAAQFSWRALRQAIWGGILGLVAFAPALTALAWFARRIDPGILPPLSLSWMYWLGLALLPAAAGLIAYVAALATVRRTLAALV